MLKRMPTGEGCNLRHDPAARAHRICNKLGRYTDNIAVFRRNGAFGHHSLQNICKNKLHNRPVGEKGRNDGSQRGLMLLGVGDLFCCLSCPFVSEPPRHTASRSASPAQIVCAQQPTPSMRINQLSRRGSTGESEVSDEAGSLGLRGQHCSSQRVRLPSPPLFFAVQWRISSPSSHGSCTLSEPDTKYAPRTTPWPTPAINAVSP